MYALPFSELHDDGLEGRDLRWLVTSGVVYQAQAARQAKARTRPVAIDSREFYFLNPSVASVILAWSSSLLNALNVADSSPVMIAALKPQWNADRGQLWWSEHLVKEYRVPAPSQALILSSFEELGWVSRIDDPLPLCMKSDRKDRLHEAIKGLNRNQRSPLLSFSGDGKGKGVCWSFQAGKTA